MIALVMGMPLFRFSITNFKSRSVCDENKSPQPSALPTETSGNFTPENSLRPCKWQSQIATC